MWGSVEELPGMDAVPSWISDIGVIPLVVLIGYLILSGSWVPKRTVNLIIAQYDKLLAAKDQTIESQNRQIETLQGTGQTTLHLLKSLREATKVASRTDGKE